MKNIVIQFNRMDAAIAVLREVASWGREQGYRVWPDEWLTEEALITTDAGPENFCVGLIDGEIACAFILQWTDAAIGPIPLSTKPPICINSVCAVSSPEWV